MNEPIASPKTIINDLLLALYSQEAGWSDEIHRAVVRAIQRIEALVAAQQPGPTVDTVEAFESHHSITQFSGVIRWVDDADYSSGPQSVLEMWLPQEPFGHISQQSLRALAEGADVTIMDLPTKDGIAVDSIIIEPRIKPIYGERDRKGFYVVPEGNNAE